ncbi:hypothetical protein [Pseudoalteromonas sp. S2755]|uniref:hypothetical protein n=1 Tax=Pseudoalteromonas sp. S2755 TaxID=2066523 RepID=UPI00110ACF0D|nr:hypothetical protein [Pseudoalteromonas sp. S2755]TMN39087.1 hypothetical protein CWC03_10365 [Pseudoalteromonas sp. S2755]
MAVNSDIFKIKTILQSLEKSLSDLSDIIKDKENRLSGSIKQSQMLADNIIKSISNNRVILNLNRRRDGHVIQNLKSNFEFFVSSLRFLESEIAHGQKFTAETKELVVKIRDDAELANGIMLSLLNFQDAISINNDHSNNFNELDNTAEELIQRLKNQLLTQEHKFNAVTTKLFEIKDDFENYTSSKESRILEFEEQLNQAIAKSNKYSHDVSRMLEETAAQVDEKISTIEDLLSVTSQKVIANDFSESAKTEKIAADYTRYGSLAFMTLIVGIVCYTFWDLAKFGLDWQESIFRTVLIFALSVPAAYLSRESTKHRQQQYSFHQTALELTTITPYISSLDLEAQQEIKTAIAHKLFGHRQSEQTDSFPLNTQEIIIELIKKLDIKNPKSDKGTE